MSQKVREESELPSGTADQPLATVHLARLDLERQVGKLQDGRRRRRPPKQGPDAGQQLGVGKRLDQLVVGAAVEPPDPIRRCGASCQKQDGQLAIGSQLSADLQAVHPGHHDVEHHQVGPPVPGLVEGRRPAQGDVDLVTLRPEDALNRGRNQGIVVHDQDAAWPCAHVRISSPAFVRML